MRSFDALILIHTQSSPLSELTLNIVRFRREAETLPDLLVAFDPPSLLRSRSTFDAVDDSGGGGEVPFACGYVHLPLVPKPQTRSACDLVGTRHELWVSPQIQTEGVASGIVVARVGELQPAPAEVLLAGHALDRATPISVIITVRAAASSGTVLLVGLQTIRFVRDVGEKDHHLVLILWFE